MPHPADDATGVTPDTRAHPDEGWGTELAWTEHYAILDARTDGDDVAHLRGGTRLMLNGLALALGPSRGRVRPAEPRA